MSIEAGRRRPPRNREFSAGGVVVNRGKVVTIVPTRRAADGSRVLALPKGHVDPGETPIQAAAREVREETGVVAPRDDHGHLAVAHDDAAGGELALGLVPGRRHEA